MIVDLRIGRRKTGISVRPDPVHPKMWRIHQGVTVSDMVNLTRAKDAAIGCARPRGLGQHEVPSWHGRETASEAPSSDLNQSRVATQLPLPFDEPERFLVTCDQPSGVFRPGSMGGRSDG
jgi:hypothetical protein